MAALGVFSSSGFRDGSLRDIAKKAGLTHAGMRHHFPTKTALLEAVLRWRDAEALAVPEGRSAPPAGEDVLRRWLSTTERNLANPLLIDLEVTLSAEAVSPDHPAHAYFADHYRQAMQLLVEAFSDLERRDLLAAGMAPARAASLVMGTTVGLQQLWLWDREIDVLGELRSLIRSLVTVHLDHSE